MDFKQDDMHQDLISMYRDFAQNEVKPIAAGIDKEERFPEETVAKMAEMGMLGIPFPEEYGGAGMDNLSYIHCIEELSKVCASTGVIVSAHTSLCAWPIFALGSEEQKRKFLIPLARGEKIGALGMTEPGAGTDAAMQRTTAVLDGDSYILNGSKCFITNAGYADIYFVLAMTDREQGTRGISGFIVERGAPGFTVGKSEEKMGIRASATAQLIFDGCRIPKENLLGEKGRGFRYVMMTLDGGRIGIGAQAIGIAQGAINETIPYVSTRIQFGKRISEFQNTQFELADMQTKVDAARLMVYRAACMKDAGEPYTQQAAMAKLFSSEVANDVTRRCVQLFGGYGYMREYPMERMMRDAKITEIYEGTSEVQKMVISAAMGVK